MNRLFGLTSLTGWCWPESVKSSCARRAAGVESKRTCSAKPGSLESPPKTDSKHGMEKEADKALLSAVLEPKENGALQQIAASCAAGADPNGICPEGSTSTGYVRPGSTLLTHAIHEWSSRVVQKLLECGADPNLEDQNGWTPWMASTLVDESEIDRIQEFLLQFGASRDGEHIGQLVRFVFAGDVEQATKLTKSDRDMKALSNFRVDLVGCQIASHNVQMLEFLLERNMLPTSTHLLNAIRAKNLPGVDLLLRYGLPPERSDEAETPLMTAAAMGELKIVQRLVEAGANVNRSDRGNIEWTASFFAKRAGKKEVASWLTRHMNEESLEKLDQIMEARDPKFRVLYEHATAGEELSTDEIVEVLKRWDEQYGVEVKDASADGLRMVFSSLPSDFDRLYSEIVDICPGVSENKSALKKDMAKRRSLFLWWD